MARAINSPGHGIFSFGIYATNKHYLKGKKERIGKLGSKKTKNIGMLASASKDISIKFCT